MTPAEEANHLFAVATHETNYRTVASRAYYACFNRSIAYAVGRGFARKMTGADHRGVQVFLTERAKHPRDAHLLYRVGSTRLQKLKMLRSHADYLMDVPFGKATAQEAVDLLHEIIGYLDQVEAAPDPTP